VLAAKPTYATPGAAYLPAGWKDIPEDQQQELLKKAGMPVVGNEAIAKLQRDHGWFNFASGATDLASRWWLDPTVLAGRAVGAARAKYVVTPRPRRGLVGGEPRLPDVLLAHGEGAEVHLGEQGPAGPDQQPVDVQEVAMGPRAGGIISQLKSPEEVNLFLRTTLGDVNARAQLQSANASAATRMEQDNSRLSNLELGVMPRVQAMNAPNLEAMVQRRADELRTRMASDEDQTARYTAALDHYGELDALNLTSLSPSRAYARTSNQRLFRTGAALGTTSQAVNALGKSRIYANDLFGSSSTLVRSFGEKSPNGMIAIDDIHPEAIDELRAHIARIPGIGPDIRASLLNNYLKTTTEGERMTALDELQGLAVTKIAEKHGFTHDEGLALYREYRNNITHGQDELRRYSGANFGDEKQSVDLFAADEAGTRLKIHPNMVTKLANNQVLIDLPALDKTLARNASALKALRTSRIGNPDWMVDGLDHISHLWKFATLFRLGYIPRVLSDDLLGQVARLGAGTMAARTGYGVKNLATNLFHWKPGSFFEGQEAAAREGVKYADEEIKALQPQADSLKARIDTAGAVHRADLGKARTRATRARTKLDAMDQAADPVKYAAMRQLSGKLDKQVTAAENRLANHSPGRRAQLGQLQDQLDELVSHRDLQTTAAEAAKAARAKGFRQSTQLDQGVEAAPGVVLPPALGGEQGEYYQKLISSDDSLRTLLQRNKQMVHSNLQKAYGDTAAAPISYPGHEGLFVDAWHKAINHQIMQDDLARQAVKGASADEMARWLKSTPAGRAYRKRLGIKYDTPERIAASAWHEVDEYMPAASGVREAALNGEADTEYLTELAKTGQYPQYVHSAQLGEALAGSNAVARTTDRVIDWWYKWAASIPADRMSRHPLFNQLYEGHARALAGQEMKQGVKLTQKDADRLAETARRLALKDTRKLVFDIAHRSDAGAALRFMSPFYAATTEAWQRWARIIADRPQTVGYASIFFNAPTSWGWMQDADGNRIQKDGTSMVWDDKAQKLVPSSCRSPTATSWRGSRSSSRRARSARSGAWTARAAGGLPGLHEPDHPGRSVVQPGHGSHRLHPRVPARQGQAEAGGDDAGAGRAALRPDGRRDRADLHAAVAARVRQELPDGLRHLGRPVPAGQVADHAAGRVRPREPGQAHALRPGDRRPDAELLAVVRDHVLHAALLHTEAGQVPVLPRPVQRPAPQGPDDRGRGVPEAVRREPLHVRPGDLGQRGRRPGHDEGRRAGEEVRGPDRQEPRPGRADRGPGGQRAVLAGGVRLPAQHAPDAGRGGDAADQAVR
jgi:hypothetical protein